MHLRASHEGGQVTIVMRDDGHGIDLDKVRARAVERGLLTAAQAKKLSRARHDRADLPAGLLDGRSGDEPVGPRRRHGRRQDEPRADRRQRRGRHDARQGHDLHPEDPAHARDHPGAARDVRRPALRDPAGQPDRARASDPRADRAGARRPRPAPARPAVAPRVPGERARRRGHRGPLRITSSCCRPTTAGSGSWSTASPTRPRSSSSRSAPTSRASTRSPAPRSWATAAWG